MYSVVTKNLNVLHGTPCFAGTRVPAETLFDYLEDGHSIEEFLIDFPGVKREQVTSLLGEVREGIGREAKPIEAYESPPRRKLPHRMRNWITGHEVFTATYMKWSQLDNGELVRAAADEGFDMLISADRGLTHVQNLDQLPLTVVVVALPKRGKVEFLQRVCPELSVAIDSFPRKTFLRFER